MWSNSEKEKELVNKYIIKLKKIKIQKKILFMKYLLNVKIGNFSSNEKYNEKNL